MENKSTLKRKHEETQVAKKKGLFQEGAVPDHYYPIGDNFFVIVSIYQENVSIHIRKFARYDDSYYPTTVGLTLKFEQFTVCFQHGPPTSIFDIVEINLALETVNEYDKREFYLLMADDGRYSLTHEKTCRNGRVYKRPIDISFAQWNAVRKVHEEVVSSYVELKYKCRDFLKIFKHVHKQNIKKEKPRYDPKYEEAERDINICLISVLYIQIGEKKGITPPMRVKDEEIQIDHLVSVKDFNESCLYLNIIALARELEKELLRNKLYPEGVKLIDYLSEEFLSAIHFDELIKEARKDFCSYEL